MIRFTTYIILFAISSPLIIADDACKVTDSTKGTIDISTLSSTDGSAKFKDLIPTQSATNWKYSFNPCQPFSEGTTCVGVAVCQVEANGPDTHILAKHDSAKWDTKPFTTDNPTLSYQYNADTGQKNVQIEFICNTDPAGSLEAVGEIGTGNYQFRLSSKCSCWNGCQGKGPSGGGGSGFPFGAIFLIALVALAVIYFTVFALYNRFRLQASGRDLIAHRTFWVGVPVYAKDGVVYLFRRATGKGGEYRSV